MLDDIEGMMNDIERAELEAEQAGREDYVRECMSEVDVMNAVDQDHEEHLHEVWLASLSPEERAEHDARLAANRAELAAYVAPGSDRYDSNDDYLADLRHEMSEKPSDSADSDDIPF